MTTAYATDVRVLPTVLASLGIVAEIVKSRKGNKNHEVILTSEEDFEKACTMIESEQGGLVYNERMPYWIREPWVIDGEVQHYANGDIKTCRVNRIVETFFFRDATVEFVPSTRRLTVHFYRSEDAKGFKF